MRNTCVIYTQLPQSILYTCTVLRITFDYSPTGIISDTSGADAVGAYNIKLKNIKFNFHSEIKLNHIKQRIRSKIYRNIKSPYNVVRI
jgi:hypothetical protein